MSDDDSRDRQLRDQVGDNLLGLDIQIRCAFVENEEIGLAIERPGQQYSLALSTRQG